MGRKRERLEIIRDILKIVKEKRSVGPTKLLQHSNLSPQMFKEYTESLENKNLLRRVLLKKRRNYELTGKGLRFLEEYKTIESFVDSFGL